MTIGSFEPLPIAIVGLHFGNAIIRNYLLPGQPATPFFKLAAVCSMEPDVTEAMAIKFGAKAVHDLDALLADPTIPVIGLYTGPNGRADLIRKIIRAGKHVMTTKPFEIDPTAALDVLLEAQHLGKCVHLNSPGPVLPPDLQQILNWQKELNLGQVIGCRAEVWSIYHEKTDGTWYDDPRRCPAAPIFRLGIYLINDVVRLLGPAAKVSCLSTRMFTGRPTADNAQLTIQFCSGAIASIYASFCIMDGQSYKNALTINFERGTVYRNVPPLAYDATKSETDLSVIYRVSADDPTRHYRTATTESRSGDYQWESLYRAIKGEALPDEVTPETIVTGVRIVNAMARAEQTGCIVDVD